MPTLGNSTGGVQKGKFINSLSQKSEIFDSSLKTREPRALPRRNHHPTAPKIPISRRLPCHASSGIFCFIFFAEATVVTTICYFITTHCFLDRSCQEPSGNTDSDTAKTANRNTGFKSVHFFFPWLRFSAFGTLCWNTGHSVVSFPQFSLAYHKNRAGASPRPT